jgi:hypothetical protein
MSLHYEDRFAGAAKGIIIILIMTPHPYLLFVDRIGSVKVVKTGFYM